MSNYPPQWFMLDDEDDEDEQQWDPTPTHGVEPHALEDSFQPLRDMGMTVLYADKASDIDNWPSLASMFGMEDSAGDAK